MSMNAKLRFDANRVCSICHRKGLKVAFQSRYGLEYQHRVWQPVALPPRQT